MILNLKYANAPSHLANVPKYAVVTDSKTNHQMMARQHKSFLFNHYADAVEEAREFYTSGFNVGGVIKIDGDGVTVMLKTADDNGPDVPKNTADAW